MIPDRPREVILNAYRRRRALLAFNVSNLESIQAVIAAAEASKSPVILQISMGAIKYAGYAPIVQLAQQAATNATVTAFVHLDHCTDPSLVEQAIADGFSSVMFDGSRLATAENIAITSQLAEFGHSRGVAVEGEIGLIGGSESMTLDDAKRFATSPKEARYFADRTDVDVVAPAIGSIHRMADNSITLDLGLVDSICRAVGRPLALHGGSGVEFSQLPALVQSGMIKINISSRIGRAMAAGIREAWDVSPDDMDMRRFLGRGRSRIQSLAAQYFDLWPNLELPAGSPEWSSAVTELE